MKIPNEQICDHIEKLIYYKTQLESKYLGILVEQCQYEGFNTRPVLIEHIEKKEWRKLFSTFPTEYYLLIFLLIQDKLTSKTYWQLLGEVLQNEVCFSDYSYAIMGLLNNPNIDINFRDRIMTAKERKLFSKENSKYIYRGCVKKFRDGFSWTPEFTEALGFAYRRPGISYVYRAEFDKGDVIAFFERDTEIFIEPNKLKNITPLFRLTNLCPGTADSFHRVQRSIAIGFYRENKIFQKIIKDIIKN
ncbi:MAG: hypothetical protein WCA84_16325 [Ignavibacteriaceae bacterium]